MGYINDLRKTVGTRPLIMEGTAKFLVDKSQKNFTAAPKG